MSKEKVLLEGWLEKKSPKKVTKEHDLFNNLPSIWQKRYFVFVRVGKKKAELRYYAQMHPSSFGGNIYTDRKGLLHINSKSGRCRVEREGRSPRRFTCIVPRVSGSHHGIKISNRHVSTELHAYALRAPDSNEARRWYVALDLFLRGDDDAGMAESSDEEDEPAPARRSSVADREAQRRAALRRRRIAANKARAAHAAPAPVAVVYVPPPPVQQQPVYARPTIRSSGGRTIPGIRSLEEIQSDRKFMNGHTENLARGTKLQTKPPAGVRRASALGKSMFQSSMSGSPTTSPSRGGGKTRLSRTVSMVHREIAGTSGLENVMSPPTVALPGNQYDDPAYFNFNSSAADFAASSSNHSSSFVPPPPSHGDNGRNYHQRTASAVHREIQGIQGYCPPSNASNDLSSGTSSSMVPPPPKTLGRGFSMVGDILNGKGTAADMGLTADDAYGEETYDYDSYSYQPQQQTQQQQTQQQQTQPPRISHGRGFSMVDDILSGNAKASHVGLSENEGYDTTYDTIDVTGLYGATSSLSQQPPQPPQSSQLDGAKAMAVRSALNRSPSRRTMGRRKYSSSLETVGETASDSKESLLNTASKLYQSSTINRKHYVEVRDAILHDDKRIVSAFKRYVAKQ